MSDELIEKLHKPLGHKAYGSIPHLSGSRMGPVDIPLTAGQERILTEKARPHDRIYVTIKLDGSNVAVAKKDGQILALSRAGYLASETKFELQHMFAGWVDEHRDIFAILLDEGERVSGEWLAQAHGTIYDLSGGDPFYAFDMFNKRNKRIASDERTRRLRAAGVACVPLLHAGGPIPLSEALCLLGLAEGGVLPIPVNPDSHEGVVYRVERYAKDGAFIDVDVVAKYVKADKVDGKYIPEWGGMEDVWLWKPHAV